MWIFLLSFYKTTTYEYAEEYVLGIMILLITIVCDTKILLSFIKHNKEWVFCGSLLHRIKIKNDYMTTPFKIIKDISKHSEKRDRM